MTFPTGKFVKIDWNHPSALGICDYTGLVFNRKDLVKQMEWRGNALVWTGFYVGKPFAAKPNPQLIPPILPPDPVPILDPRPEKSSLETWEVTYDVWNFDQNEWQDQYFSNFFDGVAAMSVPDRMTSLQNFKWNQ